MSPLDDRKGWVRALRRFLPFVMQKCRVGNLHWRWERLCGCGLFQRDPPHWHGGVWDIQLGIEYHACVECYSDWAKLTQTFRLTKDEAIIVLAYRDAVKRDAPKDVQ